MPSQIDAIFAQLVTPEFGKRFQEAIERDRQAGREWRHSLVVLANNKIAPDEQQLALQERFIAAELDRDTFWHMICDLSDKAGVKRPEPTPRDMGLD